MKKLVRLTLAIMIAYPVIGIAILSCADESDCSIAGRAMLNGAMRRIENNTAVNDTLDSLWITAIGTDSTILNMARRVSSVSLPLRYTKDTTILIFHYSQRTRDTVIFRHSNTPKFVSMECGYEMMQAILGLKYTRHRLDSIHITSYSTNTDGTRNLEIFHRQID